ncbi:MAG: MBL fold metallo-hydrolase [Gemmatimonadetes bacterium]|nr:MBL fold metallo-hydrolase [Gemmatimonadota bacterium]
MLVTRAWRRRLLRFAGWSALALLTAAGALLADGWRDFGARTTGARRVRMERSPQWHDGHFENPQPLWNDFWGSLAGFGHISPHVSPVTPPVVPRIDPARFASPPAGGLRITWFGHSSTLVEIDGHRILTDPIWSDRASPWTWLGPHRWYPPPIALADLPRIDAVVISHDHFDHLDRRTIEAMRAWTAVFVVPLGIGAHLAYWGIPENRIVELDWWEAAQVGELTIVATPARHASGRMLVDYGATLWAGFALLGRSHRVYYSGDTGPFPALNDIGRRYGPFDVTMVESGQYNRAWPDWHIGPEQAVLAHQVVRGQVIFPVHWGLFPLAFHAWTEPVERVLARAAIVGAAVVTPPPGESIDPLLARPAAPWWPKVPWETAAQHAIVSTLFP